MREGWYFLKAAIIVLVAGVEVTLKGICGSKASSPLLRPGDWGNCLPTAPSLATTVGAYPCAAQLDATASTTLTASAMNRTVAPACLAARHCAANDGAEAEIWVM